MRTIVYLIYFVHDCSNHMLRRVLWDKLPECIFESFETALVKRGQFQIFPKLRGWFIQKVTQNERVMTGQSHQTNKHFVLKLISFNSGQLQINKWQLKISGPLQNNIINSAMSISVNRVIIIKIVQHR